MEPADERRDDSHRPDHRRPVAAAAMEPPLNDGTPGTARMELGKGRSQWSPPLNGGTTAFPGEHTGEQAARNGTRR